MNTVQQIRDLTPEQTYWLLIELAGEVSEETFERAVEFAVTASPAEVAS